MPLPVIFGFNSNVRVGERNFHVQTEDRGPLRPVIETVVFQQGRALYHHTASYEDLLDLGGFVEEQIRERLGEQHRRVVEQLRAGSLPLNEPEHSVTGLVLELQNPRGWLAAGRVRLDLMVRTRAGVHPVAEATVEVTLTGAEKPLRHTGRSDSTGRAQFDFPMPRLGPGGGEMVIRAAGVGGVGELRFHLKPRAKAPAP